MSNVAIGILVCGLLVSLSGCMVSNETNSRGVWTDNSINVRQIQKDMPAFDLEADPVASPSIASYFDYYGINIKTTRHYFGYFHCKYNRISAHVFIPQNPKGTLFLLHGYLDHAGSLKHLINETISHQFAVAVFDLPGHGLSSGERGGIDDFSTYAETLGDFIALSDSGLPKPFHLVGHSTGCAIAFEYMHKTPYIVFDKVVFLAPLVHNANWLFSKIGVFWAKFFVDTIPRKYRENSSDISYLTFVQNDPLQVEMLSVRFLKNLHKWDGCVQQYTSTPKSVLIIQGTGDSVVDWQYNIAFLKTKIDGLEVELVEGGKHQLVNEKFAVRKKAFDLIFQYIDPGN